MDLNECRVYTVWMSDSSCTYVSASVFLIAFVIRTVKAIIHFFKGFNLET